MDPDETLKEIRRLSTNPDTFVEALDLFGELDTWLKRGGFLPSDWTKAATETVGGVPYRVKGGETVV